MWLKKLDDYLNFGENDSTSDCLLEIISMGYKEYLKFYEYPQMVIDYFENDEYEEGFVYCFPDEEDYDYATLEFYKIKVNDIRQEIKKTDSNLVSQKHIEDLLSKIEKGVFIANQTRYFIESDAKKLGIKDYWVIHNLLHYGQDFYGKVKKDIDFNNIQYLK